MRRRKIAVVPLTLTIMLMTIFVCSLFYSFNQVEVFEEAEDIIKIPEIKYEDIIDDHGQYHYEDDKYLGLFGIDVSEFQEEIDWETCLDRIHERYDENCRYDWCHVLSNAMIVMTALHYGDGDLEKTIGIALSAGFDTDCNAATAGSVVGMINGASHLPEKWIAPLHDTLLSGVDGFGKVAISSMAQRTMKIAVKILEIQERGISILP